MKLGKLIGAALLAALFQADAGLARDQLGQNDAVVINPQRAYIFYRTGRKLPVTFLREVDEAALTAWRGAREQALQRARQHYQRDVADYESAVQHCRGIPEPCINRTRPVDPTASFAFPAPEMDRFVTMNGGPQFTHDGSGYTYLRAVEPGTYILYGQMLLAPNGAALGVCLCMGSVKFAAEAGRIVDLGTLGFPRAGDESGSPVEPHHVASVRLVPPAASAALPDRLANLPVVQAELHGADKLPNFFGIEIDRMSPLAGVLAYRRDLVIDERTGQPATSGAH
jgi:hypothetical protein